MWYDKHLYRLSGTDLTRTELPYCQPPPSTYSRGGYEYLATRDGILVYSVGVDRLVYGLAAAGAAEHGWQEGLQPGRTHAIRQAPNGRVWVLRDTQLLFYDPSRPSTEKPAAWPGWQTVPIAYHFTAGGFGSVWYWQPDRRTVVRTEGDVRQAWTLPRGPGHLTVSDRNSAVVSYGGRAYVLKGTQTSEMNDPGEAVLILVREGATQFGGYEPPVLAADGRVCVRGKLWDGKTWHELPVGRVSRDLRGELLLLDRANRAAPFVYRIEGTKAVGKGHAERCLIDVHGLRWYDPGLVETDPGRLPVWHDADKQNQTISLGPNGTQTRLSHNSSLQALRLADGLFLVRVDDSTRIEFDKVAISSIIKKDKES